MDMATPTDLNPRRKHADLRTKLRIFQLLQLHLAKGDDGYWQYRNDYDDHKIAEEIGEGVVFFHVKTIRREMFGKLKPHRLPPKPNPVAELEARVAELEAVVERLKPLLALLD
jgi:hypothetical protein